MLVTIVTPSFNQGRFIEKTIQSVLEQDYPNIEYIVMDGGSTDGTVDILRRYGDRITWRSERDAGQSDAINKGFRMAKGDIVAWLNSDDFYLPGAVSKVVEVFRKEPEAAMVYGDGYIVDEREEWRAPYGVEPFFDLWKLIHFPSFVSQPSTFMRREAILSIGLLNTKLYFNMDWDLWIRMSRTGKVVYLPEKLSCARVYPETKTQSGGWKRWIELVALARHYGNYKLPPAIFLNVPKGCFKNSRGGYSSPVKKVVSMGRMLLNPFTRGGGASGFSQDGYMSGSGFISLPMIKEAGSLALKVESVVSGDVMVRINNMEEHRFILGDRNCDIKTIELKLSDKLRQKEFLHLEFRRSVSLRIRDLYYVSTEGRIITNLGFPNLI